MLESSRVNSIFHVLVLLGLIVQVSGAPSESGYLQKIRHFSFDMQMMHEYPNAWNSYNSAVPILSKVKVVPALQNQSGQFFMKKELETPAWDVTYQVGIEQSD